MAYALINSDGTLHSIATYDSFTWRGILFTAVSRLSHSERRNYGIYDYAQKYAETPASKKHCGFTQEINHEEAAVYEVPIFIDKSPEEIANQQASEIKAEITALESAVTPRRVREAVLSEEGKLWLAEQDSKIKALRDQLTATKEKSKE